jgi:acyl-CoA dehydrogenase
MMHAYRSPWMTDELEIFRDSVRRFIEQEFVPKQERWNRQQRVDRDAWDKAGAMGMLCPDIPEQYGGAGSSFAADAIVLEELIRAGNTSFGSMVHSITAHYILGYGTEAQKRRWLPRMATGELIAAIAMSEPAAGSDLQGIKTRALREGDHYRIHGSKTFISNGQVANLICVVVKTDPKEGARGTSLIVIETEGLEGFRRGRTLEKIGQKGQDTAELFFDDCRVPAEWLLGGTEAQGFYQLMNQLPRERLMIAVVAVAAMERAVALTASYTKERRAFGQPIAEFQNTRFTLAECKTEAVIGRVFVDWCIKRLIAGELDAVTASMAKWWTTQKQCDVIDACLQLHGGYGYMLEFPIAQMFADARVQKIYGGSNEIMKELIARSI